MHDKYVPCDTKLPLTSISTSYMDMSISDFIAEKASPLLPISGPCVIKNHAITFEIFFYLKGPAQEPGIGHLCQNRN